MAVLVLILTRTVDNWTIPEAYLSTETRPTKAQISARPRTRISYIFDILLRRVEMSYSLLHSNAVQNTGYLL